MTDYRRIEQLLTELLGLRRRPVAVAFGAEPPAGVAKFAGTEPSSCSFWRLAAGGQAFYTVAGDHYNCPIGSYTHNIAEQVQTIAGANATLLEYHRGRRETLASE